MSFRAHHLQSLMHDHVICTSREKERDRSPITFQNAPTDRCSGRSVFILGQIQRFYDEPRDTVVVGGHGVVLQCSVVNLQGPLQWMKSGFGLGPGPLFDGYPRYRIVQQLPLTGIVTLSFIMSPLRRHTCIFVCFMAKSAFWVFFGPSSVKGGRTHIVLG